MREVETSGKTVDEAIAKALAELGVARDDVEIEVLSEGKSGFLGLGSEEARVFAAISGNRTEPIAAPPPRPAPASRPADLGLPQVDDEPLVQRSAAPSADGGVLDTAEDVVAELLAKMGLRTQLARYEMPNPMEPEGPIVSVIDIRGDDLGLLIGRRGETLDALQYIVSLIVQRRLQTRVNVEVDVEGYRQRRITSLQGMARRIADQVRETGRPMPLEPMNARERRIVHLALQEETDIVTESDGEGDHRKVVIYPKSA